MWLILDISIVLLILLTAIISAKKGFVRAVIEMIGFVAAFFVATTYSTPFADLVYDKFLESSVVSAIAENTVDTAENTVTKVWNAIPEVITANAEMFGISEQSISSALSDDILNESMKVAGVVSEKIIRPFLVGVIGYISSFLMFLIIIMISCFVAKMVNKLFSFSIIGKVNRALGGVVGIVKGIIVAVFICNIIVVIVSFTANGFLIFTTENIESSYLFKAMSQIFR